MFTIDLEKELLDFSAKREKADKKYLQDSPDAVEYLRHKNNSQQILSRFGTSTVMHNIKTRAQQIMERESKYSKDIAKNIFTYQDIKKICTKYRLRFLEIGYYKGSIADDVPSKIEAFENSVVFTTFNENAKKNNGHYGNRYMIVAPPESFILSERPKDPLLFYPTGDGEWYLVCKWGNDLSVFRYFKARFIDNLPIITPALSLLAVLLIVIVGKNLDWPQTMGFVLVIGTLGLIIANLVLFANDVWPEKSKKAIQSQYFD